MIYKRGNVYWFAFVHNGKRIQQSTHQGNKQVARDAEAVYRKKLIHGELDVERQEKAPCPTFEEFKPTFMAWVRHERPASTQFYEICYNRLSKFPAIAKAKLCDITEETIEAYKMSVTTGSRTTVNRSLACLRKALRYAWSTKKLIDRVPKVEVYRRDVDNTVERECEYVYTPSQYQAWLAAAREPLRSASVLAYGAGICRGEMLALQWDCVQLRNGPDENGFWGTVLIRRGLKRTERKRDLQITDEMAAALLGLKSQSRCQHVFTNPKNATEPLSRDVLTYQHRLVMAAGTFHQDAGLHALRHTFITEAAKDCHNVKALQRLAGHSQIKTTMRYVHPDESEMLNIAARVQQRRNKAGVTTVFTTVEEQLAPDPHKQRTN